MFIKNKIISAHLKSVWAYLGGCQKCTPIFLSFSEVVFPTRAWHAFWYSSSESESEESEDSAGLREEADDLWEEADDMCEEPDDLREEPDEPELLDALDKPEPPRKPVGVLDDLWEESDEPELLDALDKPEPPRKPVGVLDIKELWDEEPELWEEPDDLWEELPRKPEGLSDETDETDCLDVVPEEEREEAEMEGPPPKNPVSLWDID